MPPCRQPGQRSARCHRRAPPPDSPLQGSRCRQGRPEPLGRDQAWGTEAHSWLAPAMRSRLGLETASPPARPGLPRRVPPQSAPRLSPDRLAGRRNDPGRCRQPLRTPGGSRPRSRFGPTARRESTIGGVALVGSGGWLPAPGGQCDGERSEVPPQPVRGRGPAVRRVRGRRPQQPRSARLGEPAWLRATRGGRPSRDQCLRRPDRATTQRGR